MSLLTFAREFVRDPVTIGAVAPSGRELASLMVEAADIAPDHVVAELGAGTGPMTEQLLAHHPDVPLIALEPNATLAAALRARFPAAHVVERYAEHLPELAAAWGHPRVNRVVSSLPWAIWSAEVQQRTFDGVAEALTDDGRMVTFTYVHAQWLPAGRRFRRTLESRFGSVTQTRVAWANVPPAFVYVCDRPRRSPS